jgi:hypothetical protein
LVQGYGNRVLAVALAGVVFLAGCASAPSGRSAFAEAAPETQCFQPVGEVAAGPSWVSRVSVGIAGVALGALWGASEGLSVAFYSGGSTGQSTWIGAAAGAGLGLVIGLVAGTVQGGREGLPWQRPADRPCGAVDAPAKATLVQAEKDAFEAD